MKVKVMLLGAILGLGLSYLACGGDDDDDSSNNQTNTNMANNSNMANNNSNSANNNSNGNVPPSLQDLYDCTTTNDPQSCDVQACATQFTFDALTASCDGPNPIESCDDLVACFGAYANCIQSACPSGSSVNDNIAGVAACADTYTNCISGL